MASRWIWPYFLLPLDAVVREVCANKFEPLDIACREGEVIVMNSALFGRMRLGSCFTTEPGDMGCQTDVLHLIDQWCSGRRQCYKQVPNREIMAINKCSTDHAFYLEVDYMCTAGKFHALLQYMQCNHCTKLMEQILKKNTPRLL